MRPSVWFLLAFSVLLVAAPAQADPDSQDSSDANDPDSPDADNEENNVVRVPLVLRQGCAPIVILVDTDPPTVRPGIRDECM